MGHQMNEAERKLQKKGGGGGIYFKTEKTSSKTHHCHMQILIGAFIFPVWQHI